MCIRDRVVDALDLLLLARHDEARAHLAHPVAVARAGDGDGRHAHKGRIEVIARVVHALRLKPRKEEQQHELARAQHADALHRAKRCV